MISPAYASRTRGFIEKRSNLPPRAGRERQAMGGIDVLAVVPILRCNSHPPSFMPRSSRTQPGKPKRTPLSRDMLLPLRYSLNYLVELNAHTPRSDLLRRMPE